MDRANFSQNDAWQYAQSIAKKGSSSEPCGAEFLLGLSQLDMVNSLCGSPLQS